MSNLATLARPYAKAAYAHAVASDVVTEWLKFLTESSAIVLAPKVVETFRNPRIEKENVLTLFLGKEANANDRIVQTFKNFIQLLWENQRLAVLPEVAQQFTALHLQSENIVEGDLVTAQPISDEDANKIKHQFEKKWQVKLKLTHSVDESLLGGALIRVGDRVFDGSVKTQIALLTKALEKF